MPFNAKKRKTSVPLAYTVLNLTAKNQKVNILSSSEGKSSKFHLQDKFHLVYVQEGLLLP